MSQTLHGEGAREGVGHCLTVYFDNHLPSVFAAAVLRPQPLQMPESCKVKQ